MYLYKVKGKDILAGFINRLCIPYALMGFTSCWCSIALHGTKDGPHSYAV